MCFRLLDDSDSFVATSNTVAIKHVPRQSNASTSSVDDIRDNRGNSVDNTEDSFKRYERIRRTLSHSRRRYSTLQRKTRAEREALKQSNKENVIVASGNYETSGLPKGKQDDLETSLSLDRDSSEVADREMAELSGNDDDKGVDLDDSLKVSKTFSSLRRGVCSELLELALKNVILLQLSVVKTTIFVIENFVIVMSYIENTKRTPYQPLSV